ncbi:unnamed protein product [marine sediment metagenome]|uniref:B12-binding N-terminal domain-containing protein n=1 Tax=marine sediment metagenome TaxID=412755 RepID=X1LCB0_9ZZZZ
MNEWILRMITLVVGAASPEIRESITELVNGLAEKAKATPNPIDDVLVGLLKVILNIKD